ncbi:hypothetical protein BDN70DRAFT_621677 [Pholiota conissans]|uniref:Protein kinase domain-containing protein n=1 Tax=Pholiota conissans TaxID=109636 RepID=A0A9P5Z2N2_9AGAR|nr:hypothetical protein BDN70DRAFT_621677 [Pholiota conissans]
MPLLRPFNSPRFDTIGECVDFFQQIFEGVQFFHHNHIAHRDCTGLNVMMDGSETYPKGFHARRPDYNPTCTGSAHQKYTRTQRSPKYCWIDFGLSARLDPTDEHPLLPILRGNDKSVPEHQDPDYQTQFADVYPTDIYYLDNLIREYFIEGDPEFDMSKKFGLDFMKPFVDDMVQDDPTKRPTIDECVIRLDEIARSLSSWTLRGQVWHESDNIFGFLYRFISHWTRCLSYIIRRIPPIPRRQRYL